MKGYLSKDGKASTYIYFISFFHRYRLILSTLPAFTHRAESPLLARQNMRKEIISRLLSHHYIYRCRVLLRASLPPKQRV